MGDLSKNFSRYEFACHCGCGFDQVDSVLVRALQTLRDRIARPIHVLSGCRCRDHNQAVGGSPKSQHLIGRAADIMAVRLKPRDLAAVALGIEEFARGGIGIYPWGVHLDVRPDGPSRRAHGED